MLSVFEGVPQTSISKEAYERCTDIVSLLSTETNSLIFKSKGEARKMVQQGGISVNKEKITSIEQDVSFPLIQGKYLLAQRGKKNYYLIRIE